MISHNGLVSESDICKNCNGRPTFKVFVFFGLSDKTEGGLDIIAMCTECLDVFIDYIGDHNARYKMQELL